MVRPQRVRVARWHNRAAGRWRVAIHLTYDPATDTYRADRDTQADLDSRDFPSLESAVEAISARIRYDGDQPDDWDVIWYGDYRRTDADGGAASAEHV